MGHLGSDGGADGAQRDATVARFLGDVDGGGANDAAKQLALLSLGEIGRQVDISASGGRGGGGGGRRGGGGGRGRHDGRGGGGRVGRRREPGARARAVLGREKSSVAYPSLR